MEIIINRGDYKYLDGCEFLQKRIFHKGQII